VPFINKKDLGGGLVVVWQGYCSVASCLLLSWEHVRDKHRVNVLIQFYGRQGTRWIPFQECTFIACFVAVSENAGELPVSVRSVYCNRLTSDKSTVYH
jgi:hypothetical protein